MAFKSQSLIQTQARLSKIGITVTETVTETQVAPPRDVRFTLILFEGLFSSS